MSYRRLLAIALIAGLPGFAQAQFTTFIPPKNKVADSVKAVVAAAQKAQRDTSIQTQLTNMKTWVDSAAGLVPTDTAAAAMTPTDSSVNNQPGTMAPVGHVADTVAFRNGARAPATASPLPLLMLLGGLSLAAGLLLLRGTPARARARRDARP